MSGYSYLNQVTHGPTKKALQYAMDQANLAQTNAATANATIAALTTQITNLKAALTAAGIKV